MLNINEDQSKNVVDIVGILSELNLEEKSLNGKDFIAGQAKIKVDQEINGILRECEIPIEIYANKLTKAGAVSKLYPIVQGYKNYTSLAACLEGHPEDAAKIRINGAEIEENVYYDPGTQTGKSTIRIKSNFINLYKGSAADFEPSATFDVTGVVLRKVPEEKNGEETGRLKLTLAIVRYEGRVDVVDFIAEKESAVNYIDQNYSNGDTVHILGRVNLSSKKEVVFEEGAFGDPIKRENTVFCREFIICGGFEPLGEDESYDVNDIKAGMAKRQERIEESKNKQAAKAAPVAKPAKANPFDF